MVPCSVTGKVIRAGKLSAYKELESCWYSRFFIKVFYPVRLVSLLGSQSWSPSEHRLQLLLLLAFLLQFLDKPSNVSEPAQNWVALFLPMLRTSLLDSTSTSASRSMRLSTGLRQPMVREVTSLQQVLESSTVLRSGFTICGARNVAERPVRSSKLSRETVHRRSMFFELWTNAIY